MCAPRQISRLADSTFCVGLSAIPAGFTLGVLWSLFGVKTAFIVSAVLATGATLAFWRRVRDA